MASNTSNRTSRLLAILLLGAAILVAPAIAVAANPPNCPAPTQLSCELLTNPSATVLYDPRPEFAWVCGLGSEGFLQKAYQVVVRESGPSDAQPGKVVWDTKRVDIDQSIGVQYDGSPLRPAGKYTWQVRVWNAAGVASNWSAPQTFRTARRASKMRTSLYPLVSIPQPAGTVKQLGSDHLLIDFERAAFGYLKLQLPASQEPRKLRVRFGEKLAGAQIDRDPGGTIRYYSVSQLVPAGVTEITVRPPRDRRNTTGAAIRLPDSIGVIAPFRYVEIEGAPLELSPVDVQRIAVQYPFDKSAASFASSDPTLNAVWDICKYSIEATTFCGVYVDGDRERIPYEADAYINQLAHYGVDREYALGRYSHEYLLANPTWPTEWKQHSILMAWADYWFTGDLESLANYYGVLKSEKLLLAAELPSGLLDTSGDDYRDIVDWPDVERDGFEMRPVNTVVNAFHYATLDRMSRTAQALGHTADAEIFAGKAENLKREFNDQLWNAEAQAYVDGVGSKHSSLHANLFPLAFGLVPAERAPAVVEFVESRGMRCSVYAAQFLLEGLYEHEATDYALRLLTSRDKRSWYNMIRSGSTITLEAWDQDFKPNLDWNHAWGAAPANLIPFYLVGVRPLEPGFKKLVVQPRPGDLESITSRVPSVRGPIEVRYQRSDDATQLEVTIPGNCTANIALPLVDGKLPAQLEFDGQPVPLTQRGAHVWVDDVLPGVHRLRATVDSPIAQAQAPTTAVQ